MRWMIERVVMTLTLAFVALAVAQSASTATVAIGIGVGVAIAAAGVLVAAQNIGAAVHSREITVGGRSRQHKESLSDVAAPRHPLTPGRPLSRAPGLVAPAA